jgi:D-serine deaminase-like pyridoxal phosphate-dependent protein
MQALADGAGVALRPHVKGHKSPWIGAQQIGAGAVGLAAATLEEAAGLLRAGLSTDILITSALPPHSAEEVVSLRRLGDVAVVADHVGFVSALAAAQRAGGRQRAPIRVFADLDVGQGRGGAATPSAATAVVCAIAEAAGALTFAGVQAYEGHAQLAPDEERRTTHAAAMTKLQELLAALRSAGHVPPVVTSAGTGTAPLALGMARDPVTEIQPGSYALMDWNYRQAGATFEQALHVVTAVRSVLSDGEAVVDAGLKAVSTDMGPAQVHGVSATWTPAGDEHGLITGELGDMRPGDLVRLVPSHTDTTIRLYREIWLDGELSLPLI